MSNDRPRDRTGRPLPHGTTGVELTEEFEYDTVEEALAAGRWLWDQQRYFEAHECLEDVWHHAAEGDQRFWKGVIQVAVTCVHHQRGNARGVIATCDKVAENLAGYPDVHHGIDVEQMRVFCEGVRAVTEVTGSCIEIGYPEFPAMDDGPWFDRDILVTPLVRDAAWREAARARRRAQ